MRSVVITCALISALASVNARHVSLVAGPACDALIRSCVQGEEQAIMNFVRYSESLPCKKEHMKVVPGTCTGQGFTSVLGVLNDAQVTVFAELGKELRSNGNEEVCWKDIQFRGVGRFSKNCTSDEERQFGFCFKRCGEGMSGEGPVCFSECSDPFGVSVGALCCKSKAACAGTIAKESLKFTYDIVKTIFDGNTNPIKIINDLKKLFHDAKDLNFPDCKNEHGSWLNLH